MLDKIAQVSLLYDFYGQLLTERQRDVMRLYHEENLSLSEIAEEFSISRQGVHDALKNAEKALCEYEEKLGLMKKFEETKTAISKIDRSIQKMIKGNSQNPLLVEQLENIQEIIDRLEQ